MNLLDFYNALGEIEIKEQFYKIREINGNCRINTVEWSLTFRH